MSVQHDQAESVAHLRQNADPPLQLGVPEVLDASQPVRHLLLVPADASETRLPGQALVPVRVEVRVSQRGCQVAEVRDVGVVQLLHVVQPDQSGDHPLGEADGVCSDVLAERELVAHLGVVGVVVIDVDEVLDLDAGLFREGDQRRVVAVFVLVDVRGPVRPANRLVGVGFIRGRLEVAAALRRARRQRQHRCAHPGSLEHRPTAELCPPRAFDQLADDRVFRKRFGHDGLPQLMGSTPAPLRGVLILTQGNPELNSKTRKNVSLKQECNEISRFGEH